MSAVQRIRGGIGADEEYWLAIERGEFRISRCRHCKSWMWPANFRCGKCGSWDIDWEPVEPIGTIYTWTRNHAVSEALAERQADLPYVTLLVELPQAGGARVAGVLEGDETALKIGAQVRGRILPPSDKAKGYGSVVWSIESDAA
ncbi:OB-fold domain-containing protein [Roseomonas aeriglobus]|nr:OB-fold domain-containing protein [Roseomonas aeriglobus]